MSKRDHVLLTTASLLTVLLFALHLTGDIVRGIEPGTITNLYGVPIMVFWVYATLMMSERRSGLIILLILSALGTVVPVLHFRGIGVSRIAKTGGAFGFFFIFIVLAMGVTTVFSFILAARGLWSTRRGRPV